MDYNQNTPPHPGGVSSIRKQVNPLKQTFPMPGMTCSACFTSRPNHIAWARINKRYMK